MSWGRSAALLLGLVACFVLDAQGRLNLVSYSAGKQISGAEVCFFKGREGDLFFDRFLNDGVVRCYPSDRLINLPKGLWNFYVQHSDGLVSSHPLALKISNPAGELRPVRADLLLAARLDLTNLRATLKTHEYFAVYSSNEGQSRSRPSIRPVPSEASEVLIPTQMHILLLIVRDGIIVWASQPIFSTDPGQRITLPKPQRPTKDVIAFVSLSSDVNADTRDALDGRPPPTIALREGRKTLGPAVSLRAAPAFDTSIVTFSNVEAGNYDLELSGVLWAPDTVHISIPRDRGEIIAQPIRALVTRPRARIEVDWRITRSVLEGSAPIGCEGEQSHENELSLYRCSFGFERSSGPDCPVSATMRLSGNSSGLARVESLEPGNYYIELRRGGSSVRLPFTLAAGRTTKASLELDGTPVTGRVTRGRNAIRATVRFATGTAVSDEMTGEYRALLTQAPGRHPVWVTPCDSKKAYIDVPGREIAMNDRYDIEIPANRVVVTVIDQTTGLPITGSQVTARVLTPERNLPSRTMGATNAEGIVVDEGITTQAGIEFCANMMRYETHCIEDAQIARTQELRLTLPLNKRTGGVVHLAAPYSLGPGRVYVVRNGTVLTETPIEQVNTVHIDAAVPADADLYIAAQDYPLTRVPLPNLFGPDPTVVLPADVGRGFLVTLPASSPHTGGPIGISIDERIVPSRTIQFYQLIRHASPPQIRPGETIHIAPIRSSSPAVIYLWHWPSELPPSQRVLEPFADPAIRMHMYSAPLVNTYVTLSPGQG